MHVAGAHRATSAKPNHKCPAATVPAPGQVPLPVPGAVGPGSSYVPPSPVYERMQYSNVDCEMLLIDGDYAALPMNTVDSTSRDSVKVSQFDGNPENFLMWKNQLMAQLSQDNMLQQNEMVQ